MSYRVEGDAMVPMASRGVRSSAVRPERTLGRCGWIV